VQVSINFWKNSCGWRCQSATQSTVFATARRGSTIYWILFYWTFHV